MSRFSMIRRKAIWILSAMLAIPALSSCAGMGDSLPAEKAFALSASALSGSDRYGFSGEVSIVGPGGIVANTSRFSGEVSGHGNLKLQWSGGQKTRANPADKSGALHPLQLLEAVGNRNAKVTYAGLPDPAGNVLLRISLDESAARKRIADGLRGELNSLRADIERRKLTASERQHADRVLAQADRRLEAALSSLDVSTVCLWKTDRKTWFPRQMTERTELRYPWEGQERREERISVTNFLKSGRNGTMETDS